MRGEKKPQQNQTNQKKKNPNEQQTPKQAKLN